MEFAVARPDVVGAIHQRWLLKFWMRHRGLGRVPRWQSVDGESLKPVSDNLSLLDVAAGPDGPRFLIRFHGAAIAEVYGSADCRGKYLDEIVHDRGDGQALAAYRCAAENGAPVYTVHDIADRDGRPVQHERLLLPFARDGETVDRVLASFEFFSPEGAFARERLLVSQLTPPALRLAATIAAATV